MPTIWPAPMRPAAAPTARSLRVAIGQLWLPVGDLDGNHRRIAETMAWAEEQGSDLLVLPELAITGYPPEDLVHHPDFVGDNLEVLTSLAELAGDCVTVVGFVDPVEGGPGPDSTPRYLANAVALLYRGEVRGRYHKVLLPNYGVFDERRYFAAGERFGGTWSLHGAEVGVLVCEDLWRADVPDAQTGDGAQIIVSANASPYHRGKQAEREHTVTDTARRCGLPVVYAAGVGGQDEVVFDGGSMIADASGRIVARTPAFTQSRLVTDVDLPAAPEPIRSTFTCRPQRAEERPRLGAPPVARVPEGPEEVYRALVEGVAAYVDRNEHRLALLGLSGGVDSALVALLAADALDVHRVHALTMPGPQTPSEATADALDLADRIGLRCDVVDVTDELERVAATLEAATDAGPMAGEVLLPSLRAVHLSALAERTDGIVLVTSNKTETALGYAGNGLVLPGGFAPLKDVPKTLVYDLCRWRNAVDGEAFGWRVGTGAIPQRIIDRQPSAQRTPTRPDREIPAGYEDVDAILEGFVERAASPDVLVEEGFDPLVVERVVELVDRNERTRAQLPPGVKVTSRGFGRDRRLPLTHEYRAQVTPRGEERTDLGAAQLVGEELWFEG